MKKNLTSFITKKMSTLKILMQTRINLSIIKTIKIKKDKPILRLSLNSNQCQLIQMERMANGIRNIKKREIREDIEEEEIEVISEVSKDSEAVEEITEVEATQEVVLFPMMVNIKKNKKLLNDLSKCNYFNFYIKLIVAIRELLS